MRIAYCGQDFLIPVLTALRQRGHEIVHVFTGLGETDAMTALCRQHGIPVSNTALASENFVALASAGTELVLSAGYAHRIPAGWQQAAPMGLNLHASPLPKGRGPWPLTWTILNGETESAVVLHKLAEKWDSGDIVISRPFPVSPLETAGSLSAKVRLQAVAAVTAFLSDPARCWENAEPQQGGSTYWPMPGEGDRQIDWRDPVEMTLRRVRAFSDVGAKARLGDQEALIKRAAGWQEAHEHRPGAIVLRSTRDYLIAASDGYIYLE